MRHPISPDYDDHYGSPSWSSPIGHRLWDRFGIASTARDRRCRRIDRFPDSYALHDTSDLPLLRTPTPMDSIREVAVVFIPYGSGLKKIRRSGLASASAQ